MVHKTPVGLRDVYDYIHISQCNSKHPDCSSLYVKNKTFGLPWLIIHVWTTVPVYMSDTSNALFRPLSRVCLNCKALNCATTARSWPFAPDFPDISSFWHIVLFAGGGVELSGIGYAAEFRELQSDDWQVCPEYRSVCITAGSQLFYAYNCLNTIGTTKPALYLVVCLLWWSKGEVVALRNVLGFTIFSKWIFLGTFG